MKLNKSSKLWFSLLGAGALIWFLIRVIPKPSRASYPCQRAAFPLASAFILYVAGILTSSFAFLKFKKYRAAGETAKMTFMMFLIFISAAVFLQGDKPALYAGNNLLPEPNEPIGTGKGIFPGRVVWIRDTTAVDQQCTNTSGDYWWQDINVNQETVNNMVSKAVRNLTGKETDAEAWDAIFRYYNSTHGKGDTGYTAGEKIVIKINLNNGESGNSYIRTDNQSADTSPQIVYAILDQLINHAGVPPENIGFGDPGRNVDNIFWDKFHSVFPDVKYWGNGNGRTPVIASAAPSIFTSDGQLELDLPQCYKDAAYMINIPLFKQHHRSGISLGQKNHIGTFVPFLETAFILHYSFPCTEGNGDVNNGDYGRYRMFVDFMGHKDMGQKTILYLIDALWSSSNWGDPPYKWKTAPFNNSYPASVFASIDPVAIESVGFDFLYNEFDEPGFDFPRYSGVDDFLHQAADSSNWPENILYDPERDSTYVPGCMGVHEHWNNPADKQYSRNLGLDEGIELFQPDLAVGIRDIPLKQISHFKLGENYPNPFNPVTKFRYEIPEGGTVSVIVYDISGRSVDEIVNGYREAGVHEAAWDGKDFSGKTVSAGIYICTLKWGGYTQSRKMILMK